MAEIGLRRIAPMQLLVVAGLTRSFQTSGGGSRPESAASARHHHHSPDTRQVELSSKLARRRGIKLTLVLLCRSCLDDQVGRTL